MSGRFKAPTCVIRWSAALGVTFLFVFTLARTHAAPEFEPSPLDTLLSHYAGDHSGSLGSDVIVLIAPPVKGAERFGLEAAARSVFQTFAKDLHKLKGDAIFAGWKEILAGEGPHPNIPKTLKAHPEIQIQLQAEQLFDNRENAVGATAAAQAFFASEDIAKHAVYYLSDKDVHNGLLLAAERKDGIRALLIFLMD